MPILIVCHFRGEPPGATPVEYGLLEALSTLVSRAAKDPRNIVRRVGQLLQAAFKGTLRPPSPKKSTKGDGAPHSASPKFCWVDVV